jgi:hypothetical protein
VTYGGREDEGILLGPDVFSEVRLEQRGKLERDDHGAPASRGVRVSKDDFAASKLDGLFLDPNGSVQEVNPIATKPGPEVGDIWDFRL